MILKPVILLAAITTVTALQAPQNVQARGFGGGGSGFGFGSGSGFGSAGGFTSGGFGSGGGGGFGYDVEAGDPKYIHEKIRIVIPPPPGIPHPPLYTPPLLPAVPRPFIPVINAEVVSPAIHPKEPDVPDPYGQLHGAGGLSSHFAGSSVGSGSGLQYKSIEPKQDENAVEDKKPAQEEKPKKMIVQQLKPIERPVIRNKCSPSIDPTAEKGLCTSTKSLKQMCQDQTISKSKDCKFTEWCCYTPEIVEVAEVELPVAVEEPVAVASPVVITPGAIIADAELPAKSIPFISNEPFDVTQFEKQPDDLSARQPIVDVPVPVVPAISEDGEEALIPINPTLLENPIPEERSNAPPMIPMVQVVSPIKKKGLIAF